MGYLYVAIAFSIGALLVGFYDRKLHHEAGFDKGYSLGVQDGLKLARRIAKGVKDGQ